jgi:hypothetical protein
MAFSFNERMQGTRARSARFVGVDHDVDCARRHHEEVVRGVPFSIEVLADRDRPSSPERVERGELVLVERRERDGVASIRERRDLIARADRPCDLPDPSR